MTIKYIAFAALALALSLAAGCFAIDDTSGALTAESEQLGQSELAFEEGSFGGLLPAGESGYFPPSCACNASPDGEEEDGEPPAEEEPQSPPENPSVPPPSDGEPQTPTDEPPSESPSPDAGPIAEEPEFPSPISNEHNAPYDQGQTGTCGYTALHNAELKFGVDLDKLAAHIDACLEKQGLQLVFKKGGIKSPGGKKHWNAYLAFESTPYWLPTTNEVNIDGEPDANGDRPTFTQEEVEAAVKKFCEEVKETLDKGGAVTMDYYVHQAGAEHVVTVQNIVCEPDGGMTIAFTDPNDPGTAATMSTNAEGEIDSCTPPSSQACQIAAGASENRVLRALHERPA